VFAEYGLDRGRELETLTSQELKDIAVLAAQLLDERLALGQPERQAAVESSAAPNLAAIDMGQTRETRRTWALRVIHDVEDRLAATVGGVCRRMVELYGVELSAETIESLSEGYGVDPGFLRGLGRFRKDESRLPSRQMLQIQPLARVPRLR
jgi:hypothetical protein